MLAQECLGLYLMWQESSRNRLSSIQQEKERLETLESKTLSIILPNKDEVGIHEFIKEIEDRLPVTQIIVCKDTQRRGKGWAIRSALNYAQGDWIAFLDGDGDIPARMLLRLIPFLEDFDVVVGSKRITKSPMRRKIMTRVTRVWFKLLFGVKCDTQTGIKLFRRSALDSLNWNWRSNGFIFDVEVISRLQKKDMRIVEVPIECEIRKQLAVKTIKTIFLESLWLKWRLMWSL